MGTKRSKTAQGIIIPVKTVVKNPMILSFHLQSPVIFSKMLSDQQLDNKAVPFMV